MPIFNPSDSPKKILNPTKGVDPSIRHAHRLGFLLEHQELEWAMEIFYALPELEKTATAIKGLSQVVTSIFSEEQFCDDWINAALEGTTAQYLQEAASWMEAMVFISKEKDSLAKPILEDMLSVTPAAAFLLKRDDGSTWQEYLKLNLSEHHRAWNNDIEGLIALNYSPSRTFSGATPGIIKHKPKSKPAHLSDLVRNLNTLLDRQDGFEVCNSLNRLHQADQPFVIAASFSNIVDYLIEDEMLFHYANKVAADRYDIDQLLSIPYLLNLLKPHPHYILEHVGEWIASLKLLCDHHQHCTEDEQVAIEHYVSTMVNITPPAVWEMINLNDFIDVIHISNNAKNIHDLFKSGQGLMQVVGGHIQAKIDQEALQNLNFLPDQSRLDHILAQLKAPLVHRQKPGL